VQEAWHGDAEALLLPIRLSVGRRPVRHQRLDGRDPAEQGCVVAEDPLLATRPQCLDRDVGTGMAVMRMALARRPDGALSASPSTPFLPVMMLSRTTTATLYSNRLLRLDKPQM
jgi:hypothetical protein